MAADKEVLSSPLQSEGILAKLSLVLTRMLLPWERTVAPNH